MKRSSLISPAAICLSFSYGLSAPILAARFTQRHLRHRPKICPVRFGRFQSDIQREHAGDQHARSRTGSGPTGDRQLVRGRRHVRQRALEGRRLPEDAGAEHRQQLMHLVPPVSASIHRQSLERKRCPATAAHQSVRGIRLSTPTEQAAPERSGVTTRSGGTNAVMIEG